MLITDTFEDKLILINLKNFNIEKTIDIWRLITKDNLHDELETNKLGLYELNKTKFNNIYITNCNDNSIMKIDIYREKILGILKVGKNPTCINSFNGKIYIGNSDSNTISVIDEKGFCLLEDISVGERPTDIKIDEKNERMFVANGNCYTISIINLINKEIRSITLDMYPIKLIYEDDRLFVLSYRNKGNEDYTNLSEIEIKSSEIKDSIDLVGIFTDFTKIKGKEIYYLTNIEDGNIYIISIDKNLEIQTIQKEILYLGGMPNKIVFDGKSNIYICNMLSGELVVLDEKNQKITNKLRVGKEPNGLLLL